MPNQRRFTAIALVVVAVDLATKAWASTHLTDAPIELPGPIDLRLSYNRGVAFNSFTELPPAVLITATTLIAVGVVTAAVRGVAPWLPAGLIAGGAIANIVDRVHNNSVVDMLHTTFWPTFNLADVAITCGAALWVFNSARRTPEPSPQPSGTPRA